LAAMQVQIQALLAEGAVVERAAVL